jgi:hypothetical protein
VRASSRPGDKNGSGLRYGHAGEPTIPTHRRKEARPFSALLSSTVDESDSVIAVNESTNAHLANAAHAGRPLDRARLIG